MLRELGLTTDVAPSWSADGSSVAWCEPDGNSTVLRLSSGTASHVHGCQPVFAGSSLVTRPDEAIVRTLYRDGKTLLDESDLRRGFPAAGNEPVGVGGYDARADDLIALAVYGASELAPIELWRGDQYIASLGRLPLTSLTLVRFSPNGDELAVTKTGDGDNLALYLIDVRSGMTTQVPLTDQRAFAWSPDGEWFAISSGDEIAIYGHTRSAPVYILPVGATALAWR